MDNELKVFQKRALIAFSLTIFLVFTILFMLDAARKQRSTVSKNITEAHGVIEKQLEDSNIRLMRIESKLDILLQTQSNR